MSEGLNSSQGSLGAHENIANHADRWIERFQLSIAEIPDTTKLLPGEHRGGRCPKQAR